MKNRSSLTLFGGDFGWGGGNAFCCCQSHGSAYPDDHHHGDHCDHDDHCDDDDDGVAANSMGPQILMIIMMIWSSFGCYTPSDVAIQLHFYFTEFNICRVILTKPCMVLK